MSSSDRRAIAGIVLGCTFGGIAAFVLLGLMARWLGRRRQRKDLDRYELESMGR